MTDERKGELPKRGRPPTGAEKAIVAAALELIENDGLAKLTTKEVAARAGVSEASVFYHFGDKLGLLRAVVLAGLAPLERFEPSSLGRDATQPLDEMLTDVAKGFESFFARALPITEAVQGDPGLRKQFCEELGERDLGPHRGVGFVAEMLAALRTGGGRPAQVDAEAVGLLLVGACFLRAWANHLGPELAGRLPSPEAIGSAVAGIVAPKG